MIRQLIHTIFKSHSFSGLALLLIAIALPWPIKYSSFAILMFCTYSVFRIPDEFRLSGRSSVIVTLMLLYFALLVCWWIFQHRADVSMWPEVEKKLALGFLPLLLLNKRLIYNHAFIQFIFRAFCLSLAVFCITCLLYASIRYVNAGDSSVFFYHNLCAPFYHHAVYLSAQCLIALMLCHYQPNTTPSIKFIKRVLYILFSGMIILLASKLMMAIFAVLLILKLIRNQGFSIKELMLPLALLILLVISILTLPFIKQRFHEVNPTNVVSTSATSYNPSVYFDGLSLRMLQYRLGLEILSSGNRWLIGTGPYNAQEILNNKYRDLNMYQGKDGKGGYLGLNFHNQYIETAVRFGVVGLILLALICYHLLRSAYTRKNQLLMLITVFMMTFFITESVLETQRGLIMFLFFCMLIYKSPSGYRAHV